MDTHVTRRVESSGLSLSVREHTEWSPAKESVILVHGYPDQQDLWDRVISHLDHDRLHVVTYDVRGAGGSDVPERREDYRVERLVEDLVAVVDATIPEHRRFHLVGHDWGSVQLWDAVNEERTDARLKGRIASFTSISGPSLDHMAWLYRNRGGRRLRLLRQSLRSWYVMAFHIPVLPELAWRRGHAAVSRLLAGVQGREVGHGGGHLRRNAVHGLNLYRANMSSRMADPRPLRTEVPVLAIRPTRDSYLTEVTFDGLEERCSDLRRVDLEAGHWVMRSDPREVAALVSDHVGRHPDIPSSS